MKEDLLLAMLDRAMTLGAQLLFLALMPVIWAASILWADREVKGAR